MCQRSIVPWNDPAVRDRFPQWPIGKADTGEGTGLSYGTGTRLNSLKTGIRILIIRLPLLDLPKAIECLLPTAYFVVPLSCGVKVVQVQRMPDYERQIALNRFRIWSAPEPGSLAASQGRPAKSSLARPAAAAAQSQPRVAGRRRPVPPVPAFLR